MNAAAAFFDLDGTLVDSNIVRYGVEIRTAHMSSWRRALWTVAFLPRAPYYLALDAVDRSRFQRAFYRVYGQMPADRIEMLAEALFETHIRPRLFPAGVSRLRDHQTRGQRVVLVTGSVAAIARPVARHLGIEHVLATRLETVDGILTGEVEGPLVAGREKAAAIRAYAVDHGTDLERSYAYADSLDDIPMLETVGRAAVVNPGRRLQREARRRGWPRYEWRALSSGPGDDPGSSA